MFIHIDSICYAFCYYPNGVSEINWFCTIDYKIYSDNQRLTMINKSIYNTFDFIKIPIIKNHAQIARDFLKINNMNRYRIKKISELSDAEIEAVNHYFYEENNKKDEWIAFEKKELIPLAIEWCKENNILYTTKQE